MYEQRLHDNYTPAKHLCCRRRKHWVDRHKIIFILTAIKMKIIAEGSIKIVATKNPLHDILANLNFGLQASSFWFDLCILRILLHLIDNFIVHVFENLITGTTIKSLKIIF